MPVFNGRRFRSQIAGIAVRLAGFVVIVALLGMFAQMLTVAYPILASSSLSPIDDSIVVSMSDRNAPISGAEGIQMGQPVQSAKAWRKPQSFVVSGGWRLEGNIGEPWVWVHDFSGFRIENIDLPSDWLLAAPVGNDRGIALLTPGRLTHYHYLAASASGDTPVTRRAEAVEMEEAISIMAGHPRLSVVGVSTLSSQLRIIDFRNPSRPLEARLAFAPETLTWESPSQLRVSGIGISQRFEFKSTDIGGAWSRLIRPVHYEGYEAPSYLWLPLPAAEEAEPKYSLAPLLFGTLKAAVLALILAVPLSLGAAIYVGFFMSERQRSRIRPAIDGLTAFPTVVLGAVGLFWLAPRFESVLSAMVGIVVLFPVLITLGVLLQRSALVRLVRLDSLDDWPIKLMPLVVAVVVFGAWAGSWGAGFLPTGSLIGYLSSRGLELNYFNSLLVGLVLGVAIIPTIFSVAEEAIRSVPRNMASGALALGSTPWQSFRDIALPLAAPGMIAAIMVGFGRAAGETMILLMLSGNTGVIDLDLFEGLRSVSASLALELPEAPRDSSHYYVLFVMGLLLFAMTFTVNTAAELIKDRVKAKTRGDVR